MTLFSPIPTTSRFGQIQPTAETSRHPVQESVRFGADAFEISKKLKLEAEAKATTAKIKAEAKTKTAIEKQKIAGFKHIGDTVVWKGKIDGKKKTINVAEMLAFLCRIRRDEGYYPGYGTVEKLAKSFPGLNTEALEWAFSELHSDGKHYLGKDYSTSEYWLRPSGKEMLEDVYPDIKLPHAEDCYILPFRRMTSICRR